MLHTNRCRRKKSSRNLFWRVKYFQTIAIINFYWLTNLFYWIFSSLYNVFRYVGHDTVCLEITHLYTVIDFKPIHISQPCSKLFRFLNVILGFFLLYFFVCGGGGDIIVFTEHCYIFVFVQIKRFFIHLKKY